MRDTDKAGVRMRFFLCEVVARIVAIYLCVDCGRMLRDGYTERKIRAFSPDLVDSLLDWSRQVFQRDIAPIRYWMGMVGWMVGVAACCVMVIFGWFHPDS